MLRIIFKEIDVSELLSLRATCSRWKQVIESAFASKTSLHLSDCVKNHEALLRKSWLNLPKSSPHFGYSKRILYNLNSLACKVGNGTVVNRHGRDRSKMSFSKPFCTLLNETFPSLTTMVVQFDVESYNGPTANSVSMLLPLWSSTLTIVAIEMTLPNAQVVDVFKCLNALPQLRQLHLELNYNYNQAFDLMHKSVTDHLKPTFFRLERFSTNVKLDSISLIQALGHKFTHLKLLNVGISSISIMSWVVVNPPLVSNLTHVDLCICEEQVFYRLCKHALKLEVMKCNFPLVSKVRISTFVLFVYNYICFLFFS